MSIRISIIGAAGRMGRALTRGLVEGWVPGLKLAGAVDLAGIPGQGSDAGLLAGTAAAGVLLTADLPALKPVTDVFIDFSFHTGIPERAKLLPSWGVPWIIGTTGLTVAEKDSVREAAASLPVILAPNMSLGVNLLEALVEEAARRLAGQGYDIEIIETHHRKKLDAPSGTALFLGEAAARGSGVKLTDVARNGREGMSKSIRPAQEIGFHAVRGGDIAGDHHVQFLAEGEMLDLSHRATTRDTFAAGALRAAAWLHGKPAGLYTMRDVLGLKA
jgi:4-hydroxy-tetrahydrodipicolinate reductase